MEHFDVIVIGSGPGGYVCAIRCAQLGMKVALIEKYNTYGGTCMNVGCIPSKALLDSSEHFYNADKHFQDYGIEIQNLKLNWDKMLKRKSSIVDQMNNGIQYLLKKNKITSIHGLASFKNKNTIYVNKQEISGKKIVIATGSKPTQLPFLPIDKKRIITSTEALSLKEVPKELILVGGGVIGLELGSVFARLGSRVKVIEFLDRIIPTMDADLGKELKRSLSKLGMEFYLEHEVKQAQVKRNKVVLSVKNNNSETIEFKGDYCLVGIGRSPYTEGLNLDVIGVQTGKNGIVLVDKVFETSCDGVYAIGDVVQGIMLAHKAHEEGVFVAEHLAGQQPHIDFNLIPSVIYTEPEVAAVGQTEEELKKNNIPYKKGSFPLKANGRAVASSQTDGFTKVLAHKVTDEILGVHMIGARASDIIASAVTAMEYRASAEDIGRVCHPHPTFSEAFMEACLSASENRSINM